MSWRKYFSSVDNSGLPLNVTGNTNNTEGPGAASSRYASWLPEVYAGSPNRLMRYMQYDQMDSDLEINAALDTIAEFGTQEDDHTKLPFKIYYKGRPSDTEDKILSKSLQQWCHLNQLHKRAFRIFRSTIKYGDQFFVRDPQTFKLYWSDPANVEKVIVNESEGKKIETYFIKNLEPNFGELLATNPSALHSNPYGSGSGQYLGTNASNSAGSYLTGEIDGVNQGTPVDAEHVVHVSLTEGMDHNWPFGISILEPIFKVFKQKELLEDSIIIYRVHRAPERRVFMIDVGNMPPHKARQYLEQVKYEVQQKRVPNKNKAGENVVDAAYNPMSMLEDYFFAQTADGRGSKVDTLPGGENLGQIDDLRYFNNKLLRGLRIPASYLPTGPEDGSATYNDGKVGIAYIQEYRFARYVERLQKQIQEDLDREFKMFIKFRGIEIDSQDFDLTLNPPMNFSSYRDLQLDAERANLYNTVAATPFLSQQFKLKKYLGLTDQEMKENEELWREENKYEKYQDDKTPADMRNLGIRPENNAVVDPNMELDPNAIPMDDPLADPLNNDAGVVPQAPGGMPPESI
ncbi:portal protein [bacterium]|nr:portal protein [bacterium]|tara:strand:- start:4669 stop:6387 length:1719 start_codon:yes stop_codon:yes gene_type:complete